MFDIVGGGGGGGYSLNQRDFFSAGWFSEKCCSVGGNMLYLFEIFQKRAFLICLSGGGGVGHHIFSEIRAQVGHFQDFGPSLQNTQVTNRGLGENPS